MADPAAGRVAATVANAISRILWSVELVGLIIVAALAFLLAQSAGIGVAIGATATTGDLAWTGTRAWLRQLRKKPQC